MEEDYYIKKFTKEELDSFESIRKRVLSFPLVVDSLEYLITEIYRFGNYISERISEGGKKSIKLRLRNEINGTGIYQMIERIEEYEDELSIKERILIDDIRRLVDFQMTRLQIYTLYQSVVVPNKPKYFLEAPPIRDETKSEKLEVPIPVPPRCLKKLTKKACEKLIEDKVITEALTETKKERLISTPVITLMKKKYIITKPNERTISDYFRKLELHIIKKQGQLVVFDTYIKKN